jgi:hypothetical protein
MSDRINRSSVDAVIRRASTYSTAWRLTRRDGAVLCVTDHSSPVTLADGFTYLVSYGGVASATNVIEGVGGTDQDLTAVINSEYVSYSDLRAGLYDGADVTVTTFDNTNPGYGTLSVRSGSLDVVRNGSLGWTATMVGFSSLAGIEVGRTLSVSCTHELGAGYLEGNPLKCQVNLARHEDTRIVTVVGLVNLPAEQAAMDAAGGNATQYVILNGNTMQNFEGVSFIGITEDLYVNGTLFAQDGANEGESRPILSHGDLTNGATYTSLPAGYFAVQLYAGFSSAPATGTKVELRRGCNKQLGNVGSGDCYSVFQNTHQFSGDPMIPNTSQYLGLPRRQQ